MCWRSGDDSDTQLTWNCDLSVVGFNCVADGCDEMLFIRRRATSRQTEVDRCQRLASTTVTLMVIGDVWIFQQFGPPPVRCSDESSAVNRGRNTVVYRQCVVSMKTVCEWERWFVNHEAVRSLRCTVAKTMSNVSSLHYEGNQSINRSINQSRLH